MSKLTGTIITMSNLVSAGPGDWKELHALALELEAELQHQRQCTLNARESEDKLQAKLEAEVAKLKKAARAVVASAGNWIHEAQHSDDLIKLAALLEVEK